MQGTSAVIIGVTVWYPGQPGAGADFDQCEWLPAAEALGSEQRWVQSTIPSGTSTMSCPERTCSLLAASLVIRQGILPSVPDAAKRLLQSTISPRGDNAITSEGTICHARKR